MKSNPVLFPAVYPTDEQHKYIKHILLETAMTEVILTRMLKW